VLDPSIISLLKDDFEAFFKREEWFRQMFYAGELKAFPVALLL
jgi:hypothetical protein